MARESYQLLDTLSNKPRYLLFFAIFLAVLSYLNTLDSPLVLDDLNSFIDSDLVYLPDFSLESLQKLTTTRFGFSRLVPIVTFSLNHKIGQGAASNYHLTNIAIHLLCCSVLYFFLKHLLSFPAAARSIKCISAQLLVVFLCGLWVLSPVQTNAVTYLVQRMTSLVTLFYIATLLFYLRGRQPHRSTRASYTNYFIAALFTLLGAMSKENFATLPLVILMLEEMFISPGTISAFIRRVRWETWLIIILTLLIIVPLFQAPLQGYMVDGYRARHYNVIERLLTESRVVIWYMTLLLLPLPSRMNLDHDFTVSQSLFTPPTTIFSIILLAVVFSLAWKKKQTHPLFSFGIFWFFINLVIESTIIPLELVFEHRLYLPSIGFYMALLVTFDMALNYLKTKFGHIKLSEILILLMIILFTISSLSTTFRNNDWRDELTIYKDCAEKSPNKARAQANYGLALARIGKDAEAIPILERAIALGRPFYESYLSAGSNLVLALLNQGKKDEAVKKAGEIFRGITDETDVLGFSRFLHNLAFIYSGEKKYELALEAITSSLALRNQNENAQSIDLATSILASAYETTDNRKKLGLAEDTAKGQAVIIKLTEILLNTRNYIDASKYIRILQGSTTDDPRVNTLAQRLISEQEKNRKAEQYYDISKHALFNNDSRYRYSLRAADFIIDHYHPLLSIADNLLNWASRDGLYYSDPYITLYSVRIKKALGKNVINFQQLEGSLEKNPDFVPLLTIAYAHHMATGQKQKALQTAVHILDIFPGYNDWQPLGKSIKTLTAKSISLGEPGEQSF
jgi:tetratricopeptide (TPR) repeat protein